MKVKTNLKSGNMLNNVTTDAGNALTAMGNFISRADAQAGKLTRGTIATTSTLYNCLSRSLGGV